MSAGTAEQALSKSQVASKAQALAHKDLRDRHPEEYQESYQRHKRELQAGEPDQTS